MPPRWRTDAGGCEEERQARNKQGPPLPDRARVPQVSFEDASEDR